MTSNSKSYECHIWITPEAEGGYSVSIPCLPGTCSQGDTEEEAIKNISEAFKATAESYLEEGEIPWLNREDIQRPPEGVKEKWIVVEVQS